MLRLMGVRQSAWNFDRAVTWSGRAGRPVEVRWPDPRSFSTDATGGVEGGAGSLVSLVKLKRPQELPSWFKHVRAAADHTARCIALKRLLRSCACPLAAAVMIAR